MPEAAGRGRLVNVFHGKRRPGNPPVQLSRGRKNASAGPSGPMPGAGRTLPAGKTGRIAIPDGLFRRAARPVLRPQTGRSRAVLRAFCRAAAVRPVRKSLQASRLRDAAETVVFAPGDARRRVDAAIGGPFVAVFRNVAPRLRGPVGRGGGLRAGAQAHARRRKKGRAEGLNSDFLR